MSLIGLVNGLHDILVNAEGKGAQKGEEKRVRNHRDDREDGQRKENDEAGAKDDARVLHITPVDELSN